MTDPDPMATREDTRAALSTEDYREAYRLSLLGRAREWTESQQAAVSRVRELTGNVGPGLPTPVDA